MSYVTRLLMCDGASLIMKHTLDLSDHITIGPNTTLAGVGSQIWTHAFYKSHSRTAKVIGSVRIGADCYIGSNVVICAGVNIADGVAVGANATVSSDLTRPGLYVSQPLRFIEYNPDLAIDALEPQTCPRGAYRKRRKE